MLRKEVNMGEFTYEEQGTYTWLVYEIRDDEEIDSLSLGMLTKNKVPGILQVVYTPIDNTGFVKYNVSSRVSAKDYLTGMVNRERILGVFGGIINAMTSAESYMLDVNSLILDLGYIFVNVSAGETDMICVPVIVKEQKHMDLAGFFRNILFTVQFDPSENFDYVTQIVNHLNSTQMFSLAEFGRLIAGLRQGSGAAGAVSAGIPVSGRPVKGTVQDGVASQNVLSSERPVPPFPSSPDPAGAEESGGILIPGGTAAMELPGRPDAGKSKKAGFFEGLNPWHKSAENKKTEKTGKTEKPGKKKKEKKPVGKSPHINIPIPFQEAGPSAEVISGSHEIPQTDDEGGYASYGDTADDVEMPGSAALRLLYLTEGRTVPVFSFPFEIGREGSGLRIDVSKTKISRRHAVITRAGGQFLITDFSKHGTFLNGVRIPQGEPRILENGMKILLKTEEFEVRIDRV